MADNQNKLNTSQQHYIELFSTFRNYLSCSTVQDIEYEYRCEYVQNTTECQTKAYFFNYIEILYCTLGPKSDFELYAYLIFFIFLCFIVFFILGTTADKFFCPSLEMLSKKMGLSEHLAGVTLIAFGNGSPDLFTSLASIDNTTATMYSNLVGGAIFVTAFVGGFICLLRPMQISGTSFIRDTSFFILGTMYIDYALETNDAITTTEAVCMVLIYVIYLVVVLLEQYLVKREINNMEKLMGKGRVTAAQFKSFHDLRQHVSIDIVSRFSGASLNLDDNRSAYNAFDASSNYNLCKQFLDSLNPVDPDEWAAGSCFQRAMICLKAPMNFMLLLLMPIVSYERERHGWSKLLNCIQIITLPFITTLIMFGFSELRNLFICCYTLGISIPLALLVFALSRTDRAPEFHVGIACLTAYGSMFVIYSCASETVEILYVLGLVLNCSNSFLGTTLLAWGNGAGDLLSNAALALHGYQKMAFAACYGGPFFNTIFTMGLTLLIMTLKSESGSVHIPPGPLGENCFIFILIILFCSLMWSVTTNFHIRRSVGIFNILLYILFLSFILLGELEVIQTFAELKDYDVSGMDR